MCIRDSPKTFDWNEVGEDNTSDGDELVLRNTFLNSKAVAVEYSPSKISKEGFVRPKNVNGRLRWVDNGSNDKTKLQTLIIPSDPIMKRGKVLNKKPFIKSILKGSAKVFELKIDQEPQPIEYFKVPEFIPDARDGEQEDKSMQKGEDNGTPRMEGRLIVGAGGVKRVGNSSDRGAPYNSRGRYNEDNKRIGPSKAYDKRSNRPTREESTGREDSLNPKGPQTRSHVKKLSADSRGENNMGMRNDQSLKNLLVNGKDQMNDSAKSAKDGKITRKDLIKLTENTASKVTMSTQQENTISFSTIVTPLESKNVASNSKTMWRRSVKSEDEENGGVPDQKTATDQKPKHSAATGPLKIFENGAFASSFSKAQQMYHSEPLRMAKLTIDSSIFGGKTAAKPTVQQAPKVNNFLGGSFGAGGNAGSSNRAGPVKLQHDLFDHFVGQQKSTSFVPTAMRGPQLSNSLKVSPGYASDPNRDENEKAGKTGVYTISFPGRQYVQSSQSRPTTSNSYASKGGRSLNGSSSGKRQSSAQPGERGPLSGIPFDDVGHKMKSLTSGGSWSLANTISIYGTRGKN
eukprot:TRINITY_DN17882_c0_g1_i2.p1 TRINITY_DN17882_c0_g1~~TRINITY_DN17882_c0_g1_i2.p1  ORF type:complete len:592 (-),score=130.43 TRINITY_DN17882_c0_g1_i2:129-1844(-)